LPQKILQKVFATEAARIIKQNQKRFTGIQKDEQDETLNLIAG
jgi:hypothetical protein